MQAPNKQAGRPASASTQPRAAGAVVVVAGRREIARYHEFRVCVGARAYSPLKNVFIGFCLYNVIGTGVRERMLTQFGGNRTR